MSWQPLSLYISDISRFLIKTDGILGLILVSEKKNAQVVWCTHNAAENGKDFFIRNKSLQRAICLSISDCKFVVKFWSFCWVSDTKNVLLWWIIDTIPKTKNWWLDEDPGRYFLPNQHLSIYFRSLFWVTVGYTCHWLVVAFVLTLNKVSSSRFSLRFSLTNGQTGSWSPSWRIHFQQLAQSKFVVLIDRFLLNVLAYLGFLPPIVAICIITFLWLS